MQGGFTSTAPLIRVETWRTRCHTLLHRPSDTPGGRRLRIATFALILLSTACFILQSIPELHGQDSPLPVGAAAGHWRRSRVSRWRSMPQ